MKRIISSTELIEFLDIKQEQLASLREKGLKGMRTGHGKWAFLVEDVVNFLRANIEEFSRV
ncbi:MAG TPA: hypothetical protein QF468_13985 [Nitrospinota bacterium]|nr:hypothetical protein [Nitrospinota bacterium]